jgi:hypothetical protein
VQYREVLVVKGKSKRVQKLADVLIGIKGVQHGRLVMTVAQSLPFENILTAKPGITQPDTSKGVLKDEYDGSSKQSGNCVVCF